MRRGREAAHTLREVIDTVAACKTIREAAEKLNLTRYTVYDHLRVAREKGLYERPAGGCLKRWIAAHPDQPLPRSVKDTVELTGCTVDSVKSYLKRRRQRVLRIAKGLGDFLAAPDFRIGKTLIQPRYWKSYTLKVDTYALTVLVKAIHTDGEVQRFYIPLRSMVQLLRTPSVPRPAPTSPSSPEPT